MVGFVHAMDHITIFQEELEKVQHQLIWKSPNTNLLTLIQLRLDNNYPILIVLASTNSYLGISMFVGAGPFLILPEMS